MLGSGINDAYFVWSQGSNCLQLSNRDSNCCRFETFLILVPVLVNLKKPLPRRLIQKFTTERDPVLIADLLWGFSQIEIL